MTLQAPKLDDRSFQEFVDELKNRARERFPQWTDHNLSDPGVALLELFAYIAERTTHQLNQVPDRAFVAFLEMLGVELQPRRAAEVELCFFLANQVEELMIPAGTEVSSSAVEGEDAIVFSTLHDLQISQPHFSQVLSVADHADRPQEQEDLTKKLKNDGVTSDIFLKFDGSPDSGTDYLLYFGSDNSLSGLILQMAVETHVDGWGIDPDDPPLVWECATGGLDQGLEWTPCHVKDRSNGFNKDGFIDVYVPKGQARSKDERGLDDRYWIRVRYHARQSQSGFRESPDIRMVSVRTIGGQVDAVNATFIEGHEIGVSDGSPGQVFYLPHRHRGIVKVEAADLQSNVVEVVLDDGRVVTCESVESFAESRQLQPVDERSSSPENPHVVWNLTEGAIRFGPLIRGLDDRSKSASSHGDDHSEQADQPTGRATQYGWKPPKGSRIRVSGYAVGGGERGNVPPDSLQLLRTYIRGVGRVTNREQAKLGADEETLDNAKIRGPLDLRTNGCAITAADFEYRVLGFPGVERARCLASSAITDEHGHPGPNGAATILVVTDIENEVRPTLSDLELPVDFVRSTITELDRHKLAGLRLTVRAPGWVTFTPIVLVAAVDRTHRDLAEESVREALYREFHPTRGGIGREGTSFGMPVTLGELERLVARAPHVDQVLQVGILRTNPDGDPFGGLEDPLPVRDWELPLVMNPRVFAGHFEGEKVVWS